MTPVERCTKAFVLEAGEQEAHPSALCPGRDLHAMRATGGKRGW